jgi:hypothetical protein
MEFKIVYGNHGKDPFHVMDTLLLIKLSLEALGHKADLEELMTPGKTNILMECFSYDFIEALKEVHETPGTEFIIVATEFVTGETFNDFSATENNGARETHYDVPYYWKKRFRTFLLAQQRARAVWHLADSQVAPFRQATQRPNVHYLPHGHVEGFARIRNKPAEHKDIDAIFTGTLTRYRSEVFSQLERHGLKVLATKPLNIIQREDLIARSRLGLNVRQTPHWRYPSNSRYHYHLSNESLLVSEPCEIRCDLSPYVIEAEADQLAEACHAMLEGHRWLHEARDRAEQFRAEMPMERLMANLLEQTYGELDEGTNQA